MADEIPAYMYPYVPYSSPYLLLPLPLPIPTATPTTTTTPPLITTRAPPAFLEGWGQDRVRGRHLTTKYYYRGVVRFRPIQSGGRGGGGGGEWHMLLVILNTLKWGGPWGCPRPTTPIPPLTYYPYSSPYLLLSLFLPLPTTYIPLLLPLSTTTPPPPLPTTTPTPPFTYYYPYSSPYLLFPWSEVTSMVSM